MTTSHLTNPAKDAGQVIGYSHPTKQPKTVAKCLVMRSPELCCSRIQNAGSRSDELLCKLRFFILSRLVPASLATFFNTLFDGRLKE